MATKPLATITVGARYRYTGPGPAWMRCEWLARGTYGITGDEDSDFPSLEAGDKIDVVPGRWVDCQPIIIDSETGRERPSFVSSDLDAAFLVAV